MRRQRHDSPCRWPLAGGAPRNRQARLRGSKPPSPAHRIAALPLLPSATEVLAVRHYRQPLLILSQPGALTATNQIDLLSSNATNSEVSCSWAAALERTW